MTNIFDVAAYILSRKGTMTSMKLQKLCYYSKAWGLVWDDQEMFLEQFEAWANGPVCPELYKHHKGKFQVSLHDFEGKGDPSKVSDEFKATIDGVLEGYGDFSGAELSSITHSETPWLIAREGLAPSERSNKVIENSVMADFYEQCQSLRLAQQI